MDLLRLSLSRLGPLCEVRTHITRVGSSKEKNYLPFLCKSKTLFVVSRKITKMIFSKLYTVNCALVCKSDDGEVTSLIDIKAL